MNAERLFQLYDRVSEAPDAIPRLRKFILDLAVRGKLVEQDPNDEPAQALLNKIEAEKARLFEIREIRKPKRLPPVTVPPYPLPKGWVWTRIRQVTSDRGQTTPTDRFTYIDVTAIDKEVGAISEPKILESSDAPSRARKITRKGDVIYSCVRPYLLNVALITDDFDPAPIASTAFAILNGHGLLDPRYIWVVLRSPFMVGCVEENQRGQAYPAINDADFSLLPFPLPPLYEQHRIVAKVDELMTLCDSLEAEREKREATRDRLTTASLSRLTTSDVAEDQFKAHANFAITVLPELTTRPDQIKVLRQTILDLAVRGKLVEQDPNDEPADTSLGKIADARVALEAQGKIRAVSKNFMKSEGLGFSLPAGWAWCLLIDIADVVDPNPSHRMPRYVENDGLPFISSENFWAEDQINFGIGKRVSESTVTEQRRRFQILPGAFGFTRIGTIGKTRPLPMDRDYAISHAVCVINPVLSSELSMSYLRTAMGVDIVLSHARGGTRSIGVPDLGMGVIRSMTIPLPPRKEQERIAAKVDRVLGFCNQLEIALSRGQKFSGRLFETWMGRILRPSGARA